MNYNIEKNKYISDIDLMKSKRLDQISSLVLIVFILSTITYVFQNSQKVVIPLAIGIIMMFICKFLNYRNKVNIGNLVLIWSVFIILSTLIWVARGIYDTSLLAYPVTVVLAGLLLSKRQFYVLLFSMCAFIIVLTIATQYGIRTDDLPEENVFLTIQNILIIFFAGGISIWSILSDLHKNHEKLHQQILLVNKSQKELAYTATHDHLTGIYNRDACHELITKGIHQSRRSRNKFAVLFIDIDDFKNINDTMGHNIGDEFLKHIADLLKVSIRETDLLSRHGGDEFLIGLNNLHDEHGISIIANNILKKINTPLFINDQKLQCTCSMGVAIFPDDGSNYDELLQYSDIAMYKAKALGRNNFCFYDALMQKEIQKKSDLTSELKAAIINNEFILHYQPIVNLKTNKVTGAEALVRWNHPKRGLLAPLEFIELSEKTGLIVEIGELVLNMACLQLAEWQKIIKDKFIMSVNLSPVQFSRGDIINTIKNAVDQNNLDYKYLKLEITESTLVQDNESFIAALNKIKAFGIQIAIDDFGTGYSNLSCLQKFNIDTLKIDQSFVRKIIDNSSIKEKSIVHAIVQMANGLNLATTAEGIETEFVKDEIIKIGCEYGQGYFFDKPLSSDSFFIKYIK